jgi:hypothetical protein
MTSTTLTVIISLSTWAVGSFIVFMVCYIYDHLKQEIVSIVIGFWPIMLPVLLSVVIVNKIQKIWVVIGGPKIRKLAPDRKQQEYEKACDHLRMALYEARNINVSTEVVIKMIMQDRYLIRHGMKQGVAGEEIIQIVKDMMVKDIMES